MIALVVASLGLAPGFMAPAEFESQQSVWLSWATYDHKRTASVHRVQLELARTLAAYTKVETLAHSKAEAGAVRKKMTASGIPTDRSSVRVVPNAEIWIRDFGPQFVRNASGRLAVADFGFDFWSYAEVADPIARIEESVDRQIAAQLNLPVLRSPMVSEGGNREVNGRGTLMVVEEVERERNPGWSRAQMEAEYRRLLGATRVVWLQQGVREDDLTTSGPLPGGVYTPATTGGHVDNVARFADPSTVLLAEVTAEEAKKSPIYAESRRRLERNYQILSAARDQDGMPFRIVRVPCPDLMVDTMTKGDPTYDFMATLKYPGGKPLPKTAKIALAASYLNFVVSNGVVVGSKFGDSYPANKRKDAAVEKILREAFPGRRIVLIDSTAVNLGGGGLHCITQPMPVAQALGDR